MIRYPYSRGSIGFAIAMLPALRALENRKEPSGRPLFLSRSNFSLEGSRDWLVMAAKTLPLTHMVGGARKILLDGASLTSLWPELSVLAGMTVVFLLVGSVLFRWE